jgi:hypothetical protein
MQRQQNITLANQQDQKIYFHGEPILKSLNGIETLILPTGHSIPLFDVIGFNGISFNTIGPFGMK